MKNWVGFFLKPQHKGKKTPPQKSQFHKENKKTYLIDLEIAHRSIMNEEVGYPL